MNRGYFFWEGIGGVAKFEELLVFVCSCRFFKKLGFYQDF